MPTGFATARKTTLPITASGVNQLSGRQDWAQGTDIASAAAITLPDDGNLFFVTGTTQINDIQGAQPGTRIALWFQGICPLGDAGNLKPRGGARSTEANEVIVFEARDNLGTEWIETATSAPSGAVGPQELTTIDAGLAGGQRSSIDGTVGSDAVDVQPSRDPATAATGNFGLVGLPNAGDDVTLNDGVNPAVEFEFAVKASGNVALSGQPNDADTVVIDDGVNPAVTFEFDSDASVVESSTLRQVVIGATVADTIDNFIAAVNGAPTLDVTASDGTTTDDADLKNDNFGTAGNVALTGTDTAAVQTLTGMSGGTAVTGDVGVEIGATAAETISNFIAAVNGATIDITAAPGAGDSADLAADATGSTANRAIENTDGAGVQTITGMSGGRVSVAVGPEAIGVGHNTAPEGNYGISIGGDAAVEAANIGGISIGKNSRTAGDLGNIAIGYGAQVDPTLQNLATYNGGAIAIGVGAYAKHREQIIIGRNAIGGAYSSGQGARAVAIGVDAQALSDRATAIGDGAQVVAQSSFAARGGVAVGYNAIVQDAGGIAIGRNCTTDGGVAIGEDCTGFGISIGANAGTAGSSDAICIGNNADADGSQSVSVGRGCNSVANRAVAIGPNVDLIGDESIGIGSLAEVYAAAGGRAIAIGNSQKISGEHAIGIGTEGKSDGDYGISIGPYAVCYGAADRSLVIGGGTSTVQADHAFCGSPDSVSIGFRAKNYTGSDRSVNIGVNSRCTSSAADAVVIGYNTQALRENSVLIGAGMGAVDPLGSTAGIDGAVIGIGTSLTFSGNGNTSILVGHELTIDDSRNILIGHTIAKGASFGFISDRAVVIGSNNTFTPRSVVIGHDAVVDGSTYSGSGDVVVIGNGASALPNSGSSVIIGSGAIGRSGGNNVVIGAGADAFGYNNILIGKDSNIGDNTSGAIGLGGGVFNDAPGSFAVAALGGKTDAYCFTNYNASIAIGPQVYGYRSIGLGTPTNRIEVFKIGATPLAGYSNVKGTNGSGRHDPLYGSGTIAIKTQGPIDMVAAYTGPVRRFWAFDANTTFFIDDLYLASYTFDTLTTHGYVSVTGLQRTATSTTTTATTTAGTSVAIAVTSEVGFSAGDWVLAIEGNVNSVGEKIKGIAKVESVSAGQITIDLQAENEFNNVVGTNIVLLSGTDGNILASTQLATLSAANQRESIVGSQTQGYDVIVVTRETAASATAMKLIPTMKGTLQEMKAAWTYSI